MNPLSRVIVWASRIPSRAAAWGERVEAARRTPEPVNPEHPDRVVCPVCLVHPCPTLTRRLSGETP